MGLQVGRSKPQAIERMGSYVDWDDPTLVPFGLARLAKNMRYIEKSAATRYGLQRAFSTGVANSRTSGLGILNFKGLPADDDAILQFGFDGTLWNEQVEGSGALVQLHPTLVQLPAGVYAQMSQAQNRLHVAFSDLIQGQSRACVVDINNHVDPLSYPSIGQAWEASRYYNAGTIISPTVPNKHLYRATNAGTSGAAEPTPWTLTDAGNTVDNAGPNQITWQEFTPNAGTVAPGPLFNTDSVTQGTGFNTTVSPGAGGYAANRDIYIYCTYTNGNGESLVGDINTARVNSAANDRIIVTLMPYPQWLNASGLIAPFAITGINVYAADVATGSGQPSAASFHKIGSITVVGNTLNVDSTGAGAAPPTTNTATLGAVGNICSGQRNLVILLKNRNSYINGMANAAVITFNVPASGQRLWVGNIYVGPGNCIARVIALTLSGDPTAGPFRYIGKNDTDPNLGVPILSSVVADNATTGAYMQFDDQYLPTGGVDVTFYFTKVEVPKVSDAYYSKSLTRMVYAGDPANRSAVWMSQATDLESILQPNNLVSVATATKSAVICAREVGGVLYALKNDGGHIINSSTDDPDTWSVTAQWDASGPTGPRAVDVFDSQDANSPGSFMVYWHDTGMYLYQGSKPVWVSEEMTNVVARVNLAVKHLIWVKIDDFAREVHVGLPLDGAVLPNKVLTLNYAKGWNKGYEFYPRAHGYIAIPGRCWSLDDIQASSAIIAQRNLTAPPDPTISQRQLLFASAIGTGNGAVWMQVPNYYSDLLDGATKTAIDSQYKGAFGPKTPAVQDLVGAECQGKGNGSVSITVAGTENALPPGQGGVPVAQIFNLPDWYFISTTVEQHYAESVAEGEDHQFAFEITNKNTADNWFQINHYAVFAKPKWKTRL